MPHETSFDDLFRRYAGYIARVGFRVLGRDDELDDLVQEVFIEAHKGLHNLRDAGAVKSWLARVTVRRALRRIRWLRLRSFLGLATQAEFDDVVDPGATPEEHAHIVSTYRLLDRLPAQQRLVWILSHVEGESLDDIATICACSKSTVQRRLRAAQIIIEEVRHGR